jgi:hypothetical protein
MGGPMKFGQSPMLSQTSMPLVHEPEQEVMGSGPPVQQRSPAQSLGDAHSMNTLRSDSWLVSSSPVGLTATHSPRRTPRCQ